MKRFFNYIKGVREEFDKIVFPSRKEVTTHSTMVVISILVAVIGISIIDAGLALAVKLALVAK